MTNWYGVATREYVDSELFGHPILSLWPSTWEQKHNRNRMAVIERVADELTGTDYARYNRIVDAVELGDHKAFVNEVLACKEPNDG